MYFAVCFILTQLTDLTSGLFPGEEPVSVFFLWGVVRVPCNAGNTVRFFDIAQEYFKVGALPNTTTDLCRI